jgi:hypothetical protein
VCHFFTQVTWRHCCGSGRFLTRPRSDFQKRPDPDSDHDLICHSHSHVIWRCTWEHTHERKCLNERSEISHYHSLLLWRYTWELPLERKTVQTLQVFSIIKVNDQTKFSDANVFVYFQLCVLIVHFILWFCYIGLKMFMVKLNYNTMHDFVLLLTINQSPVPLKFWMGYCWSN